MKLPEGRNIHRLEDVSGPGRRYLASPGDRRPGEETIIGTDQSTTVLDSVAIEEKAIQSRRTAAGVAKGEPRWALALSGGGIRSATFALGVLQQVAAVGRTGASSELPTFRSSLLSRFDYLSTVSGGGYVGAFLCALFRPGRLRLREGDAPASPEVAAEDAVNVLSNGVPGRIRVGSIGDEKHLLSAPLAWLRDNGRYLVPTGTGDALYAAALGLRGWMSLHVVVGALLVVLFASIALVRQLLAGGCGCVDGLESYLFEMSGGQIGPLAVAGLWPSSLLLVAAALLLFVSLPIGIAYWFAYPDRTGRSAAVFNRTVLAGAVFIGILGAAVWLEPVTSGGTFDARAWSEASVDWSPRMIAEAVLAVVIALAYVIGYLPVALHRPQASGQRTMMTRHLTTSLNVVAVVLGLGVVETLGQSLYLSIAGGNVQAAAGVTTFSGGLVWLVRKVAALAPGKGSGGWVSKLPLTTLAGVAGILIFVLLASLWAAATYLLVWLGDAPLPGSFYDVDKRTLLLFLVPCMLLFALVVGHSPGFLNLSSLHSFYSSRLTRAYLGASNGERFLRKEGGTEPIEELTRRLSVSEPLPSDTLTLADFWEGGVTKTHAPLHIINVTVNKTVDPAEQLVQRDRKGLPLAVLPMGFTVDGEPMQSFQAGNDGEISSPLNLGQWIGTSGAAFSTGIGRETSLGMSLLMGVANVRLGLWWESGQGRATFERSLRNLPRAVGVIFRTQTYLSYEFRARFFGLDRQWQYLSDGGHFENTGIYELLRRDREVRLILACDSGADPEYRFDDLSNLIRLARIDLKTEITIDEQIGRQPWAEAVFGTPKQFRPTSQALVLKPEDKPNPCALLLKASRKGAATTWIVLLKPSLHAAAPQDVRQYAALHPQFPQEPTADQFFDEAQWESYRALGQATARRVLNDVVWPELQAYVAMEKVPATSALSTE